MIFADFCRFSPFPRKVNGLKWVQKWVERWVFGCKSGPQWVKTHLLETVDPFRDIDKNPFLTHFKGLLIVCQVSVQFCYFLLIFCLFLLIVCECSVNCLLIACLSQEMVW